MKKIIACAALAATFGAVADEAFTFVNDPSGYSYIQINQDVDSFNLNISKYGEAKAQDNRDGKWGEGHFKYFTYKGDAMTGLTTIEKGATSVEFGSLSAGTKIGFAFDDRGNNEWAFNFTESGRYQNGGSTYYTYTAAEGETLVNFNQTPYTASVGHGGGPGGHGGQAQGSSDWDDWMVISASATAAQSAPSGAPLPGVLAVLLVGGVGAGALKFGKRKQRA